MVEVILISYIYIIVFFIILSLLSFLPSHKQRGRGRAPLRPQNPNVAPSRPRTKPVKAIPAPPLLNRGNRGNGSRGNAENQPPRPSKAPLFDNGGVMPKSFNFAKTLPAAKVNMHDFHKAFYSNLFLWCPKSLSKPVPFSNLFLYSKHVHPSTGS